MTLNFRRNLLTGIATAIPLIVTVFVFSFFLELLSDIGRPKVVILANAVRALSPDLARWLVEVPWLSSTLAVLLTVGMLYFLGMAMSRLVGRRILRALEDWLKRIPLVTTVYGATKKVIETFHGESAHAQRVVLIEFPHSRMKAVGLVTRILRDEETGEDLAAVYVPTAPNPTGGYLEIVPVAELVTLDWTVDEAMTFVLSGGTTSPDRIRFGRRPPVRPGGERWPDLAGAPSVPTGHPREATG
jgi:uncharacterized membrane protein